jgi:LacI family transcriptional regulator
MEEWTVSLQSWLADLSAWPTAFVCEGDFRAVALLRAAAACGRRAPEDFSCVGAGNTPYCEMTNPALTSVSYNEAAMASLATLFSRQAPPPAPEVYRVAPDLIERNSVTPGSGRSVVATAPFGKGDPT